MKKVALMTGASAGIGKQTAKLLFKGGYIVYGAARRMDKMKDIQSLGVKILEMNLAPDDSMVSGVNAIIKAEGRIDILINNAGFGPYGALVKQPSDKGDVFKSINVFFDRQILQNFSMEFDLKAEEPYGGPNIGYYHQIYCCMIILTPCFRILTGPTN